VKTKIEERDEENWSSSSDDNTDSTTKTLKSMGLAYCALTPQSCTPSPSPSSPDVMDFIIDSGSTVHMTNDKSILFNYNTAGAKTVEPITNSRKQLAVERLLSTHATVVGTSSSCESKKYIWFMAGSIC
jgi:hypothetical protein